MLGWSVLCSLILMPILAAAEKSLLLVACLYLHLLQWQKSRGCNPLNLTGQRALERKNNLKLHFELLTGFEYNLDCFRANTIQRSSHKDSPRLWRAGYCLDPKAVPVYIFLSSWELEDMLFMQVRKMRESIKKVRKSVFCTLCPSPLPVHSSAICYPDIQTRGIETIPITNDKTRLADMHHSLLGPLQLVYVCFPSNYYLSNYLKTSLFHIFCPWRKCC